MGKHFSEFKITANCFMNLTCGLIKKEIKFAMIYLKIFRCYAVLINFFYDTNKTKRFINSVLLILFFFFKIEEIEIKQI